MLTELGLQKFDSLTDKCRNDFQRQICGCDNGIVQYLVYLHLMWLIYVINVNKLQFNQVLTAPCLDLRIENSKNDKKVILAIITSPKRQRDAE